MARPRSAVAMISALLCLVGMLVGLGASSSAKPVPQHRVIPGSPNAYTEQMTYRPGGLHFVGWAIDPDAKTTALTVYVVVDGSKIGSVTANKPRPDIEETHHTAGPNHGFDMFMRIPQGTHTICVWARNIGPGYDLQTRCQHRTLDYGPIGLVNHLTASTGAIHVAGWTYDRDDLTAPVDVVVTVDSKQTTIVANKPNQDAVKFNQHINPGPDHGFAASIPTSQGTHNVCVRGVDIGFGSDNTFVCKTLVLNESPRTALDLLGQYQGKLRVRGWAYDIDNRTKALSVVITVDGQTHTVLANVSRPDVAADHPAAGALHGFDRIYDVGEGTHHICVLVKNVSYGKDVTLACKTVTLNFTPAATLATLNATPTGLTMSGWATDPDTDQPISARIILDDKTAQIVTADQTADSHSGHAFKLALPSRSGKHTVCVVGLNVKYGTHNSPKSCRTITLALPPLGKFEVLTRAGDTDNLSIKGWAFDPDTRAPLTVAVTVDGAPVPALTTSVTRSDIAKLYPSTTGMHLGLLSTLTATDGEHTVCLTAKNVSGGSNYSLGCKLIIAVHPVVPSAPRGVAALAGYGGATVTWKPPASDGGAPWTKYVVTARPGTQSVTVPATATSATITGLTAKTDYAFAVRAYNVAGFSTTAVSEQVRTQASPPPQTTPAPVSTSRYIRNVRGASTTELAMMRKEGAADAAANPSGHGYLILLAVGGQDDYDRGVVLSATTHFVSYTDMVKDIEAYLDGYHSKQRSSAPVVIALGTNNDLEVSRTSGASFANRIVDPVAKYAARYSGMTIAGANDMEPGFRGTYSQSKAWLQGYLAATTAPYVATGSADGCAWTFTGGGCNNGWTMRGLYYLTGGAAPLRMLNLPQIYNTTMSAQWKYISLTGVTSGQPRINFAGTLTEWTACDQANSCSSMSGHSAWSAMWRDLQSDRRLKVASLPYSTDLRIDS